MAKQANMYHILATHRNSGTFYECINYDILCSLHCLDVIATRVVASYLLSVWILAATGLADYR